MNKRHWQRRAIAAAVAGLVGVGLGGGNTNTDESMKLKLSAPINALEAPLTVMNEPIPWQSAGISTTIPIIKLSNGRQHGRYILYSNDSNYATIKFKTFYYTSSSKNCKISPVSLNKDIFLQSCTGIFGIEGSIINFKMNLIYSDNFIFIEDKNQEVRLLTGINAQVRNDNVRVPYPEFSILNLKTSIVHVYRFGQPSDKYKQAFSNCVNSGAINEYRGLLPDNQSHSDNTVTLSSKAYNATVENPAQLCRLKFYFNFISLKGGYFL